VWLVADGAEVDMTWDGEFLWAAQLPAAAASYHVCATDRQGNNACSPDIAITTGSDPGDFVDAGGGSGGGCCSAGSDARGSLLLALVAARVLRSSARTGRCGRRRPRSRVRHSCP
jgi:hypothetical protein